MSSEEQPRAETKHPRISSSPLDVVVVAVARLTRIAAAPGSRTSVPNHDRAQYLRAVVPIRERRAKEEKNREVGGSLPAHPF